MPQAYSAADCSGRYASLYFSVKVSLTGLLVAFCSASSSSAESGAQLPAEAFLGGSKRADDGDRQREADDAADGQRGVRHERAATNFVRSIRLKRPAARRHSSQTRSFSQKRIGTGRRLIWLDCKPGLHPPARTSITPCSCAIPRSRCLPRDSRR